MICGMTVIGKVAQNVFTCIICRVVHLLLMFIIRPDIIIIWCTLYDPLSRYNIVSFIFLATADTVSI